MLVGKFIKNINSKFKGHFFSGLSFNSLNLNKNNIFFAIKGTKIDGKKFIKDAIKKGARTIVSDEKFKGLKNNVLYIRVKNVRKTLSEISFKINKKNQKI